MVLVVDTGFGLMDESDVEAGPAYWVQQLRMLLSICGSSVLRRVPMLGGVRWAFTFVGYLVAVTVVKGI